MQIQSASLYGARRYVVICFKFSNFAYANTVSSPTTLITKLVVICFKFSNFAYANTVGLASK